MSTSSLARNEDRKLLTGELVEVRQKEIGLRGSWHPGVVVRVWLGRRSVEYDELLSKDGKCKLRECIPVPRGVEGAKIISRYVSKLPAQNDRGFIRPRPLPCTEMSRKSWRKGLFVDAFYEDAWWEGVLMESVSRTSDESQVTVFFPDEGDQAKISLKDLRVSQVWDAKTSIWSIKGYTVTGQTCDSSPTSEPHKDAQETKGSSVKTRAAFTSQVHAEQHQSQKVLMPSVDSGLHGVTYATGMIGQKENQAGCTATSKNFLLDSSHECLEKEETLAEWVKSAKQQALGTKVLDIDKSSGDAFKKNNNVNQGSTNKATAHFGKSVNNKESFVSDENTNKGLDPQTGKARRCHISSSNKNSMPLRRDIIREARDRAKNTLKEAGWVIRLRSPSPTKVALYISPEGKRHCRLSAACAEWRRLYGSEVDFKTLEENGIRQVLEADNLFEGRSQRKGPCDDENTLLKVSYRRLTQTSSKFHRSSSNMNGSPQIGVTLSSLDRRYGQSFESSIQQRLLNANKFPVSSHGNHIESSSKRRSQLHSVNFIEQISRKRKSSVTPESSSKRRRSQLHSLEFTEPRGRKRKNNTCNESSRKIAKVLHSLNVNEPRSKKTKNTITEESPKQIVKDKQRRRASQATKAMQLLNRSLTHTSSRNRLEVLLSTPGRGKAGGGSAVSTSKRTIISWLIDMGVIAENEEVRYLSRKDKHVMMKGQVTRDGILCKCCKMVLTLSNFEQHAGSTRHRPCANIYVSDGRSLSECQMQALKIKNATKSSSKANKDLKNGDLDGSDDTCGVCGDGGELICCDHCPSTFHLNCVQIVSVPEGDWYCPHCQCAVCGSSEFTDGESFDEMTVLYCDQCGREYHVACLHAEGAQKMQQCPEKNWFCGHSCDKIFKVLRGLVGITNTLKGGFTWTLLRSSEDDQLSTTENGLEVYAEHNSKLALALSVMQECFRPMIDPRTQIEFISNILYNRGSELKRMNFSGFYTVILERGDELISVASIRVHGARLAEMPLIGTRFQYRRQGMCRRLMSALEEVLRFLQVEILVLPAVPELLETWTNAFSFGPMNQSERLKFVDLSIVAFPGTTILQKSLSNTRSDIVELDSSSRHSVDVPWNYLQTLLARFNSHNGKKRRGRPAKRCTKNYAAFRSKNIFEDKQVNSVESNADETLQNRTVGSLKEAMMPIHDQSRISVRDFGNKVMEQSTSRKEPTAHNNNHEDNNQQEIGTSECKKGAGLNLKVIIRESSITLVDEGVKEMPIDSVKQGTQIEDGSSISIQDQSLYRTTRVSGCSVKESKKQLNIMESNYGCESVPGDVSSSRNLENSKLSNEDVRMAVSTSASNSITSKATEVLTGLSKSPRKALPGQQACIIGMQTLRSGRILLRKATSLDQSHTASSEHESRYDSTIIDKAVLEMNISRKPVQKRTNGKKYQRQEGYSLVDTIIGENKRASLSTLEECKLQDPEVATCQQVSLEEVKSSMVPPALPFPFPFSTDSVIDMNIIQTAELHGLIPEADNEVQIKSVDSISLGMGTFEEIPPQLIFKQAKHAMLTSF